MAYYDLVKMEAVERKTASILGYKKIFLKNEIPIVNGPESNGKCIVMNGEPGMLSRALRRSNVIGIIIRDNELIRQAVEEAAENGKLLVFPIRDITCTDTRTRMRNLYRMRGLMAFATHSKAKISLVTLAEDESELLSTIQMLEIAKFLGAKEDHAREMLSNLGGI